MTRRRSAPTPKYPVGSGNYYAVPADGDTQMLVYRKDLFDNADAKAAYKAATGNDLRYPPDLDGTAGDRPVLQGQRGKWTASERLRLPLVRTAACYDQVATTWNQILWSWGGELWDPATYKVEGVLNSDVGVDALQFAQELYKTGPDGASDFGFNETVGDDLQRLDRDGRNLVRLRRRVHQCRHLRAVGQPRLCRCPRRKRSTSSASAAWACTSAPTPRTRTWRWSS